MLKNRKLVLLPLALILGLLLSGCGLFNDVEVDVPTEELSKADFLNTLINDFADLVQSFIDETEYDDGWMTPGEDDLDFSALFAHYDIFMLEGQILEEEQLIEYMLEDMEYFVTEDLNISTEEFNDAEINFSLTYKYFIEAPAEFIFWMEAVDYPQEEVKFLIAMAIQEITVDEETEEQIVSSFVFVAPYEDAFKVIYFDYWGLLGWEGFWMD